jgi:nucleoside-diphosphate-sugar epimerase
LEETALAHFKFRLRIDFLSMNACVTGGTGFIGGPLVQRLLAEGAIVRVLARPSPRADELESRGAKVVRGQLSDFEAAARAVEGADVVFHIAAKVNPPGTKAEFFESNVSGTDSILKASLQNGVGKVIYLSSVAVYGLVRAGERIDENTEYDPAPQFRDYYAQSKIAADALVVSFGKRTGLPIVVLRPGLIYGPGRPLPLGLLGFPAGRANIVFGKPGYRVPVNFTENLLDAMQLVSRLSSKGLQQFNIVDDDDLTLAQYHSILSNLQRKRTVYFPSWPLRAGVPVAEAVMRILPLEPSACAALRQVRRAIQDRWYVTRRIREQTGWAPRVALREAVQRTIAAIG